MTMPISHCSLAVHRFTSVVTDCTSCIAASSAVTRRSSSAFVANVGHPSWIAEVPAEEGDEPDGQQADAEHGEVGIAGSVVAHRPAASQGSSHQPIIKPMTTPPERQTTPKA